MVQPQIYFGLSTTIYEFLLSLHEISITTSHGNGNID